MACVCVSATCARACPVFCRSDSAAVKLVSVVVVAAAAAAVVVLVVDCLLALCN